jgi:hypothetical protein
MFALRRAYRPDLWDEAVNEVEVVARNLASRLSETANVGQGHTTIVAGRRARVFEITYSAGGEELLERVAFLFVGRREYQLTCRIARGDHEPGEAACVELFRSFAT